MAVYTPISENDAKALLARYDLGALKGLEPIEAGVENTNYHLFTDKGRYILTLFEKRTPEADLPYFFAFTDHLSNAGIKCPRALADKDGQILTRVAGRPAAIISFLDGHEIAKADITPAICAQVGNALARMHLAASDFKGERKNSVGLYYWQSLYEKIGARADEFEPGLYHEIGDELDYLANHWNYDLPQASVHADLFPDNVFFKDGQFLGAIDFYFACTAPLAYDLAITLNAWCFHKGGVPDAACYDAMMDSYRAVRPLLESEIDAFPMLARAASLRFLMTRLHDFVFHDPQNFVKPKDPREYLAILRYYKA